MILRKHWLILMTAALFVGGCSFASDLLSPSLTGESPAAAPPARVARVAPPPPTQTAQATLAPAVNAKRPPALSTTKVPPIGISNNSKSSSFVGQKVRELRTELRRLQNSVSENNRRLQDVRAKTVSNSTRYHNAVATINARLQVGTTPGNPILVEQFNQAIANLEKISEDISGMNKLTTGVTSNSTLAAFLAENTRAAFQLSGAVDADHQQLAILEDEVNRTIVLIDRLLKELSEDIQRQTNYVSTERSNLNTLSASIKTGEILGQSLSSRASAVPAASRSVTSRSTLGRRPLVVIRFDRQNVAYDQAVYNAVSRALERQPSASFELVAVAPSDGSAARVALNSNQARRNAENVLRTLQRMGLPPNRVSLSARSSNSVQTNEVHLYIN